MKQSTGYLNISAGKMSKAVKISATIITLNEEKKIEACIKSLLPVADEIIVKRFAGVIL
jgi:hypothetical protein